MVINRLAGAVIGLLLALPGVAQSGPRFLIERIEVRNAGRVPPALIISETLLRADTEYSEDDLRAACARLSRLPFLLSADFALEKGTARGRYILIVSVLECTPFFYFADVRPAILHGAGGQTLDYDVDPGTASRDAALGFRLFAGKRGVAHAGVESRHDRREFTTNYSEWAVGYTQYELFGSRAYATFNLRLPFAANRSASSLSPQLVIGLPLTTSQTLTFDFEDTHFRDDKETILGLSLDRRDSERLISLAWTYDTTNDPFVPTYGTVVRIAPLRWMRDRTHPMVSPVAVSSVFSSAQHVNRSGADIGASHYWELSERDSLAAGVQAGWFDIDDRSHPFQAATDLHWQPAYEVLRAAYSRNLHGDAMRHRDSRIELEARYAAEQRNVRDNPALRNAISSEDTFRITVNWARRNSWGMLRAGVGYAWRH